MDIETKIMIGIMVFGLILVFHLFLHMIVDKKIMEIKIKHILNKNEKA